MGGRDTGDNNARTNRSAPNQAPDIECDIDRLLLDAAETLRRARQTLSNARREHDEANDANSTRRQGDAHDEVVSAEEFYLVAKAHYDDVIDVLSEASNPESSVWLSLIGELQPPSVSP